MKNYLAVYSIKSSMFDGGAWMPDPEPHREEYRFEASDDGDARKKSEEHSRMFRKIYFGPQTTLESLMEVRELDKSA